MAITIESCKSLYIVTIVENLRGEGVKYLKNELLEAELRAMRVNGQSFDFVTMSNFYGGYRWFFVCPKCGNKYTKLFLPPEKAINKEKLYLCRHCHKLKNESSLIYKEPIYRNVLRPLKRLKSIEAQLKQGHLRKPDQIALIKEYKNIEEKLKASPDYLIYTFKKDKGLLK